MKKIKLLPSILMLIACVAVLAVGVYSIAPTQNTISGSISINASNSSVKIEFLTNGVLKETHNEVRGGVSWDLSDIAFDTTSVNSVEEVSPIVLTVRITNLSSTQGLGAYFFDTTSSLTMEDEKSGEVITHHGGTAKAENILLEQSIYANGAEATDANKIADVWFTPYTYVAKNDGNTTNEELDVVEMNVNLSCFQLPNESLTNDFSFQLNIEPYYANIAKDDVKRLPIELNEGYTGYPDEFEETCPTEFNNALLKLPEDLTMLPYGAFFRNSSIKQVVFSAPVDFEICCADSMDDTYSVAFYGCSIKAVSYSGQSGYCYLEGGSCDGAYIYGVDAKYVSYNSNTLDYDILPECDFKVSITSNITSIVGAIFSYYSCDVAILTSIPPTLEDYVAELLNKVYIPKGSLEAYKTAEGWSEIELVELSIA